MLASARGGRTGKSVTWPEHRGEGLITGADADGGGLLVVREARTGILPRPFFGDLCVN